MNKKLYVVTVEYYSNYHDRDERVNALIYAENMSEALAIAERIYRDEYIYEAKVSKVADEGILFEVSDEMADRFIRNEGIYVDPTVVYDEDDDDF